ncbi:mitochondrial 37S ribosomal protein mS33 [Lipomyces oligophaga]|uniref:mitochondrial 37S ribosomal protein mS33 n=1 Tax=Lipomyces oligophaga TaxID=45792 RepID=UPI0034D02054
MSSRPPLERLQALLKTTCYVFDNFYNPEHIRSGNKILRKPLRGPALIKYYPPKSPVTKRDIRQAFPFLDFREADPVDAFRIAINDARRRRGKGPPKKKEVKKKK